MLFASLANHIRTHLLPWVTGAYITGSTLSFCLVASSPPPAILAGAALAVALFAVTASRKVPPFFGVVSCLLFFCFLGMAFTHNARQGPWPEDHIAKSITTKQKTTLIGTVSTMVGYDGEKSRFVLETEAALLPTPEGHRPPHFHAVQGRIQLAIHDDITAIVQPGRKIMVIATIAPIRNYQTPGAFDYKGFQAAKNIRLSGWINGRNQLLVSEAAASSLLQRLRYEPERRRQKIAGFLHAHLSPENAGLFQALLIGYRGNVPPPLIEHFQAAGAMHLLAISGLHLGLLGGMTAFCLMFIGKRSQWLLLHTHVPTLAITMTLPILVAYCLLAGANPPVVRATLMAGLGLYALLIRRSKDLLHLIAAAALFMLLLSPLSLPTASFQLSFAAIIAIVVILPVLPLFRPSQKPLTSSRPWYRTLFSATTSLFFVSCAATAATAPLMLFHFNRLSLVGPLMNLVLEPLICLWALPAGLLSILFMDAAPELALVFLKSGEPGLWFAQRAAAAAAQIPSSTLWTITPSAIEIFLYYLAVILLVKGRSKVPMMAALVLFCIIAGSFSSLHRPAQSKITTVHFLDIGQGNSSLLQLPNGQNILVDGGGGSSRRFNIGKSVIAPFLWKQRIWRLDGIIVSHPDADHFNGIPFVLKRFSPSVLYVNGQDARENRSYQALLATARSHRVDIQPLQAGKTIAADRYFSLSCMGMNGLVDQSRGGVDNERSLVIRLRHKARTFLLPGDIPSSMEHVLLKHYQDLTTDVLIASHHGSITSSSEAFMRASNPRLIVVSAGYGKAGTHPHPKLLAAWEKNNYQVLLTSRDGTITCTTDGKNLRATTATGKSLAVPASRTPSAVRQTVFLNQ